MENKATKVTPEKVTSTKAAAVKEDISVKAASPAVSVKETKEAAKPGRPAAEPKKEAVKAAEEPKKEAVKAAEEPKKETARKTPGRKRGPAKKKEVEKVEEIYVQFGGSEILTKDIVAKAKQDYVADGHRESSIKTLRVYLKPEEGMAYYVINDKFSGSMGM